MQQLHYTLKQPEAVQPAEQLETELGRASLEQALFPQGVDAICTFLEAHLPNSQVCVAVLFSVRCTLLAWLLCHYNQMTLSKLLSMLLCCLIHYLLLPDFAHSLSFHHGVCPLSCLLIT